MQTHEEFINELKKESGISGIKNFYDNMPIFVSCQMFFSLPSEKRAIIFDKGKNQMWNYKQLDEPDIKYMKKWLITYTVLMYGSGLFGFYLNRNENSIFNTKFHIDDYHLGRALKRRRSMLFVYYISLMASFHTVMLIQRIGLKQYSVDKYELNLKNK